MALRTVGCLLELAIGVLMVTNPAGSADQLLGGLVILLAIPELVRLAIKVKRRHLTPVGLTVRPYPYGTVQSRAQP
jgi:hypothetical protein